MKFKVQKKTEVTFWNTWFEICSAAPKTDRTERVLFHLNSGQNAARSQKESRAVLLRQK